MEVGRNGEIGAEWGGSQEFFNQAEKLTEYLLGNQGIQKKVPSSPKRLPLNSADLKE